MSGTDNFYDDPFESDDDQPQNEKRPSPVPVQRKNSPGNNITTDVLEDPSVISRPRSPEQFAPPLQTVNEEISPEQFAPSLQRINEEISPEQLTPPTRRVNEEIPGSRSSSSRSSISDSYKSIQNDQNMKAKPNHSPHQTTDVDTQTDRLIVQDEAIQTEIIDNQTLTKRLIRHVSYKLDRTKLTTPLVKTLLDQITISAVPIISFCQPFSMTSHITDIILAMPRHLMIINNQSSISVYPWQQNNDSSATVLECFWCSFLYKLLVVTLEDNRLFIYDFISIIDSIKLRGHPLSVKHQTHPTKPIKSSQVLPSSSQYHIIPAIWYKTRLTKSNSLGIYYCYISDRQNSCMLTRIDHNTRKHVKAIDCSASVNNDVRVCAMGLSDERVAIVLTNLIMTLYDAETLIGLKRINLSRPNGYNIYGVSAVIYFWKTWLIFDPIENKVVGIGKPKRQFVKRLPEQPINACSMDDGSLVLWLGHPGALLYYRLTE